jgi:tetratricopeptide (TPR) repeat protein
MRSLVLLFLLGSAAVWAQSSPGTPNSPPSKQDSGSSSPSSASSPSPSPSDSKPARRPNLDAPRSDRVRADSLEEGQSSSKDSQIDLSPPPDDVDAHPKSSLTDAEGSPANGDVGEFHPWDPHKAAKDIEVGDFYFKKKNYLGAESRYREALYYKDNDAVATYRLAVCLEKMDQLSEAQKEYENYLKILPYGPQAADAKKAIDRLKGPAASAKPVK